MVLAVKSSAPSQHQVFISFRGSDVRHNCFSFLKDALIKNDINVVTDEDAPRGKPIDENLLKLIRDSRIAVVIFSRNYPESTWCLDELVEIKKQMDLRKLDSCPIFFEIETSHVKFQAGRSLFDYNLLQLEHKERKKARQISKKAWEDAEERFDGWRRALISVASRLGLTYKKDSNQATFVNAIVEKVKEMLDNVSILDVNHNVLHQPRVFVSSRGQEIRYKFSSFLKAALKKNGMNVFIDDGDVTREDELNSLFVHLRESRIALVIITKSYTSSACCLEELVEIKKRMDMGMLVVIPIFYEVNPSELKRNDQLVAIWGNTDDRINKWKEALISIASRTGFTYAQNKSEADLVECIIDKTKKILVHISYSG